MYRAEERTCEQSRTFGMRSLPAVACEVSQVNILTLLFSSSLTSLPNLLRRRPEPSAKPSGLQLYASSLKVTVNTSLLL
jgi:hypothetical protein